MEVRRIRLLNLTVFYICPAMLVASLAATTQTGRSVLQTGVALLRSYLKNILDHRF